jgi:hypothetical protein
VTADWIKERLSSEKMTLLDARPDAEFTGADGGMGGSHVKGHLPDAHQLVWNTLLDSSGKFLPDAELQKKFDAIGANRTTPLVSYCMVGMRASVTYFVARHLGLRRAVVRRIDRRLDPAQAAGGNGEVMAKLDLLQGTLDLLILKTLALGPQHGWGISQRIQQISENVLRVNQGSLYPALQRLDTAGWIESEWGASEKQPPGQVLSVDENRGPPAEGRDRTVGKDDAGRPAHPRNRGVTTPCGNDCTH